jgi:hypothetical protein
MIGHNAISQSKNNQAASINKLIALFVIYSVALLMPINFQTYQQEEYSH